MTARAMFRNGPMRHHVRNKLIAQKFPRVQSTIRGGIELVSLKHLAPERH